MNTSLDSCLSKEDFAKGGGGDNPSSPSSPHISPNTSADHGYDYDYDSNSFSSGGGQGSMSSSAASSINNNMDEYDKIVNDDDGVGGFVAKNGKDLELEKARQILAQQQSRSSEVSPPVRDASGAGTSGISPDQYFHTPYNKGVDDDEVEESGDDSSSSGLGKNLTAANNARNKGASKSSSSSPTTWQLHLPDLQTLSPNTQRRQRLNAAANAASGRVSPYATTVGGPTGSTGGNSSTGTGGGNDSDYLTDDSDSHISYFNAKSTRSSAIHGNASVISDSDGFSAFTDAFENDEDMNTMLDMDNDSMLSYDDDGDVDTDSASEGGTRDRRRNKKKGGSIKAIQSMDTIDFSGSGKDKSGGAGTEAGTGDAAGTRRATEGDNDEEAPDTPSSRIPGVAIGMGVGMAVVENLKRIIPTRLFYGVGDGSGSDDDALMGGSGSGSEASPKKNGNSEDNSETVMLVNADEESTPQPPPSPTDLTSPTHTENTIDFVKDNLTPKEEPSLDHAWGYFEHYVLPRYHIENSERKDRNGVTIPNDIYKEGNKKDMTRGRRIAKRLQSFVKKDEDDENKDEDEDEDEDGNDNNRNPPPSAVRDDNKEEIDDNEDGNDNNRNSPPPAKGFAKRFESLFWMGKDVKTFNMAIPGEVNVKTSLYNPWTTPLSEMGDFGIGVGLYFVCLRAISIITFLSGCMSIYNISFFASDEYNVDGLDGYNFDGTKSVPWFLRGSAICTSHEWVYCPSCTEEHFNGNTDYRLYKATDDGTMTFALKNRCEGKIYHVGMVTYGTIIVTTVGLFLTYWWMIHMGTKLDQNEQTAQDYSIVIRNPPKNNEELNEYQVEGDHHEAGENLDVYDPVVWKNFFEMNFDNAHVTCCTVVVDNDNLLLALVKRREILKYLDDVLELMGPEEYRELGLLKEDDEGNVRIPDPIIIDKRRIEVDMNKLEEVVEQVERKRNCFRTFIAKKISFFAGIPEQFYQLKDLNSVIVEEAKEKHDISSVFISFETEEAQRQVLKSMSVSKRDLHKSIIQGPNAFRDTKLLFQGLKLLNVQEPSEPSTIRWMDQDISICQEILKYVLTLVVVILVSTPVIIINAIQQRTEINLTYVSYYITVSNMCFPTLAKKICLKEKHHNEDDREISLFVKILVFRVVNTVILLEAIEPYANTIMYGESFLLQGVYQVFFAEILTTTAMQYLDLSGNFKRHIIAPMAKTQEKMNLAMRGSQIFLAERYTNMCKLFFMGVWYAPIYPAVLFMCSVALFINYWMDKFSIMRTWRRPAKIGRSIGKLTRNVVFPIIVIVMTFQGYRSWSNFPFDKLCEETDTKATLTPITITYENFPTPDHISDTTSTVFEFGPDTPVYRPCNHREEWKNGKLTNEEQGKVNRIYEVTTLAVMAICAICFVVVIIYFAKLYWRPTYEKVGEPQKKPYSKEEAITAYIPQWTTETSAFPFLVCPTESIENCRLFNWDDPDRTYGFYDVTADAARLLNEANEVNVDLTQVFSRMIHDKPDDSR